MLLFLDDRIFENKALYVIWRAVVEERSPFLFLKGYTATFIFFFTINGERHFNIEKKGKIMLITVLNPMF